MAAQRSLGGRDMSLHNEEVPENLEEYANVLQQRLDSEARRYKTLYNVNPYDMTNYDLVVDTAANNPEQVIELILTNFEKWLTS